MQVRPGFGLDSTGGVVGYLGRVGVSHLYSAPLLEAAPGSAHGYDVVDPTRVRSELGGAAGLARLVEELRGVGLGLVVDVVPNHVGVAVAAANPAWWSVLRDGERSPYARWFDIDWRRGPLVLPVLADDGAVRDLVVDGDELRYFEHRFPVAPGTGGGSAREVHARQHYRLVAWRRGNSELNYRRFFAVSGLAGVRVEDPEVFADTHAEILRWVSEGLVDGIRVDHPDGLRDPGGYLRRLREAAPGVWLVVEKILEHGEELPADWPVDGTTGYDALREVCGVFVDPAAEASFAVARGLGDIVYECKLAAATGLLATELTRLERLAPDVPGMRDALAQIAARLPVYRTYPDGTGREHLDAALAGTREKHPEAVDALTPLLTDPLSELGERFAQYTGAVMAKGVEDTAFYRFNRFVALNEVGGAPDRFGLSVDEFHDAAARRQRKWPAGMTTLSTHDTKRGEDVRARLAVLAEIPDEWHATVSRWAAAAPLDDADLASLLWQTVVGAWPIERERLHAYALKAAREAAASTAWDDPDEAFEERMRALVDSVYDDPAVRADIDAFVVRLTRPGWSNSLGQKLVQLTMPGVPDVYQGTELWENSLVDPDNRRPVDFEARSALLERLDTGWLPPVDPTGAVKLLVTSRALRLRRDRPELFNGYARVDASG
ncbi:MAG TPA: malto-oligosyltrehalose synthase, partial [Micromonosporaceae bacterium]|nr:malto-oligosyltrehalose synthase [Micromonosporaceae bacterium]